MRGLLFPVSIIAAAVVASTLLLYVQTRRTAADLLHSRGLDRAKAIATAARGTDDDGIRARIAETLSDAPVTHACIYRSDGVPTCAQPELDAAAALPHVTQTLTDDEPQVITPSGARLNGPFLLWYPMATPPAATPLTPGPSAPTGRVLLLRLDTTTAKRVVDRALLHASLVTGLIALLLYLTFRQKRLVERERRLERERESERRFTELGRLSAVLAHEIRNPLGAIKGFAQLTARQFPEGADAREDLDTVVSEATRLEGLVQSLLTYARPADPTLEDEPVARLVTRTAALVRQAAEDAAVRVTIDVPDSLIWPLDAGQMTQALLNLMQNAIAAMPDGGELFVGATESDDGQALRLTVIDEGTGVPEELLATLFEPYVTGKASGTGLGLAVTRRIVQAHRGTISVSTDKDEGTTMEIVLQKS